MTLDIPWLIAGLCTIISTLAAAVGVTYRGQVQALRDDNAAKQKLIDRLIQQIGRTADVQDRTVSLVERDRGVRR